MRMVRRGVMRIAMRLIWRRVEVIWQEEALS